MTRKGGDQRGRHTKEAAGEAEEEEAKLKEEATDKEEAEKT